MLQQRVRKNHPALKAELKQRLHGQMMFTLSKDHLSNIVSWVDHQELGIHFAMLCLRHKGLYKTDAALFLGQWSSVIRGFSGLLFHESIITITVFLWYRLISFLPRVKMQPPCGLLADGF